jgi:sec-independent protein translocase protein TatA
MIFPFFGPIGTTELIIILVIVIIIFGASRLPEIGKGIGQAIKNFKKATNEPEEIDVTPKKDTLRDKKKEEETTAEKKEGE